MPTTTAEVMEGMKPIDGGMNMDKVDSSSKVYIHRVGKSRHTGL